MNFSNFCGRTRREFLWQAGAGFAGTALAGLLHQDGYRGGQVSAANAAGHENPLAAKPPHFAPKAKSVIFLFMYGGPSHIDTFDYKPAMKGRDNQTIEVKTFGRGGHKNQGRIVEPRWNFHQYGECGKWVSDLFPHLATCVDDIGFIHSMTADSPIHGSAMLMMNSGKITSGYELAFKMQKYAPEAVDLAQETAETQKLYGLDQPRTQDFGKRCLLARRLVERGVRFIQLYSGGSHNDANWDAHGDLEKNHNFHAGNTDQPIAALLKDLKQRNLLDETLVVWGGEFGRQPVAEYAMGTGRDHNAYGFTMWMAGGGIKGGVSVGTTDEIGSAAVESPLHVKRLHGTILHQMGLDPNALSYFFGGLDQKLVGVEHVAPIEGLI